MWHACRQVRLAKDRKKGDKIVTDSQERAYWRAYRPPPGFFNCLELPPFPNANSTRTATNANAVDDKSAAGQSAGKFVREWKSADEIKAEVRIDPLTDRPLRIGSDRIGSDLIGSDRSNCQFSSPISLLLLPFRDAHYNIGTILGEADRGEGGGGHSESI